MFTGDRSGDWLFRALHRAGFANQPTSTDRDDGLELHDAWITAAVRCAPPGNRPTPDERTSCANWLAREIALLSNLRVVVALGGFGWDAFLKVLEEKGWKVPRPKPKFGHLARVEIAGEGRRLSLVGSYHPSQQNTFTGRLTEEMFDAVWSEAAALLPDRPILLTREYNAET